LEEDTAGTMHTAIIHLREPDPVREQGVLARMLRLVRGVKDASYEPLDALITVRFDDHVTSLADLVRTIEDAGSPVSSVAQRPVER
jgi:hypothetical protein